MNTSYKYIDLTSLINFSNNDEKFIIEIITIAIQQTTNDVSNYQSALLSKDYKQIASICHKICSSMNYIGVHTNIIAKIKQIETIIYEEKNYLKVDTSSNEIIEIILNTINELKLILKTLALK